MVEWLDRITKGFGSRAHAITARTYDPDTGKDIPIVDLPEVLAEAYRLGQELGGVAEA